MTKELTPEQKAQACRVIEPMMDVIANMSPEEMWLAMQGFYNAGEENAPWQMFALRHTLPAMISISANMRGIDLVEYFTKREDR